MVNDHSPHRWVLCVTLPVVGLETFVLNLCIAFLCFVLFLPISSMIPHFLRTPIHFHRLYTAF